MLSHTYITPHQTQVSANPLTMCDIILLRLLLCLAISKCCFCSDAQTVHTQIHALDVFKAKINQLGELKKVGNFETTELNSGETIQEDVAQSQGRNYVGVAIVIENYSSAVLGDPQLAISCGYQSAALSQLNNIPAGRSDLLVFHNHNYLHTRTCGSASWQVRQDGTALLLDQEEDVGVRIAVTWNVHWTCSDRTLNEVTVHLMKTKLDENGDWAFPIQNHIYSRKHHYWPAQSFPLDRTERVTSKAGLGFNVTASITSGCQAVLKLEILGNGELELKRTRSSDGGHDDDESKGVQYGGGEQLPRSTTGGLATTMTVVYIVCGFAGILVIFVVIKGYFILKNRSQRQQADELQDQEEVDKFLK
eukprot:GFUD01028850.1.p1 GENE.GFUD01028850.1~~GFUD01028850.1.p1  ORF type:complete len:363 (+),score=92.40 GFUD01028850.1:197-1285(+)